MMLTEMYIIYSVLYFMYLFLQFVIPVTNQMTLLTCTCLSEEGLMLWNVTQWYIQYIQWADSKLFSYKINTTLMSVW